MHRHTISDTGDMATARGDRSRAQSFSSDRPSVASSITFQMPSTVRPPPAYIAASVASQTVTDHHNAQLREEDADADELENAVFSEQSLALLNAFLDHLLFAFLSSARSPSLTAIRPAIADVLKPRLAREATEAADEELQGLLAGEDDEFPAQDGAAADRWDVEKVWKRTRLRIMVYTRLGELEDEDEDRYVQQERGLSMDDDEGDEAGLVSWASAIFLTSVIEYVAEQTLLVAGSAAFARMAAKMKKLAQQSAGAEEPTLERLVVEEPDVEKIALNSALGRLWRTWRKRVRSPISPLSPGRGIRPVSSYSSMHQRKLSHDTVDGSVRGSSPIPEHIPTETDIAANIPLPIGDNDVNEIEVPGLARTYEVDEESAGTQTPVPHNQRPSSVLMLAPVEGFRRRTTKERPVSMPPPAASEFSVPPLSAERDSSEVWEGETPFETPMEYASKRKSYTFEGQPPVPSQLQVEAQRDGGESPQEADADMMAFAASTGMGFRMSVVDPIKTEVLSRSEDEEQVPSAGGYESEPKILQSKRMSVEKTGPPGIVRTFSTRSSSLRSAQHTPVATPRASQQPEAQSYLDDSRSTDDEDEYQHRAIGVARTSDIPIRHSPTPPADVYTDKGKYAANGGYVEVQPRQTTSSSISVRRTPTPDSIPIIPERSIARKDLHRRELSGEIHGSGATQLPNVTSAPRRQDSQPKSRGGSLPSLQEVDTHANNGRQRVASGVSITPTTPQRSPTQPVRDAAAAVADRQLQRKSTEDSKKSQRGAQDGSPSSEKSAVQRVTSSASSLKKAASINTKHGRMSEEDRERQFDSLVKGEETVKFTLTPQTVRDFDRKVEPSRPTTAVTVHPRASADRDNSFGMGNLPNRSTSRSKGPVAAQHKASPSRKVVTRPLAREPRIEQESMRDFADFIRSTGPSAAQEKPVQPFVNLSGNNSTSSLGRKTSSAANGTRTVDGPLTKSRVNMQPRSPAGLTSGNDDLIDFIRQGPPSANSGQPRIPRNVAPFRSTVDSDQFDQMLDGHGTVESAYGSTASTLDSKHSTQTINSRTGLLPEPKVVQPAYSNTPQKLSGNMASNEPHITKTRRRVKDPYAIDFSDDEDEDQLTALPPPSQPTQAPKQESLMDFLNGMDPPSDSKPQPFMLSEETIAAAKARANASNSTLSSTQTVTRNGTSPYGGNSSTSVASDAPRAYKPRLQARAPAVADVRNSKSATSDLADFLRNSGPPEPPVTYPVKKEEEKKSRKDKKANTPHSPVTPDQTPTTVFYPQSTQQTSTLLKECHARHIAVTSFGAGTSFGGALTSTRGGICISFESMKRIIALHEDDMDVTVQPGLSWDALNTQLKATGLFFAVDPSPGASIGGMIAMSCSGTNAYRYSTMKENVISLTGVLADGRVVKTHNRPRKSSAGYDLTHLVIGSEGTLALVTEAVLRLSRLPVNLHVGVVTFDTFQQGVDIVVALQKSGHKLEALELADAPQMRCVNVSGLSPRHAFLEKPTLFMKFAGPSVQVVQDQIALVKSLCLAQNARSSEVTNDEDRIGVLWGARKCMGTALVKMKKHESDLFVHSDCAVPISNLAKLVEGTQKLITEASPSDHPWFCANVGHIGDGNLHSSIVCPAKDKAAAEAVLRKVARLALSLEGTVTGEHGVGLKLRDALQEEVGEVGIGVMRGIKRSLDERGILNPDKVFRLEEVVEMNASKAKL
ncbi:hypothetical protein CC86DRAFT_316468 [Ophiobolus disseminans]|uniref:FAD-binding PCMH-type domain-containing protein n=1 Tax=Ophiobolus disseminans TaxID=1469910 RepID=A0A6A7ADQ4_9PLEO|nr:hypothetical protein CC86DRAFT_316468 [Ophiobolus disseminans]